MSFSIMIRARIVIDLEDVCEHFMVFKVMFINLDTSEKKGTFMFWTKVFCLSLITDGETTIDLYSSLFGVQRPIQEKHPSYVPSPAIEFN